MVIFQDIRDIWKNTHEVPEENETSNQIYFNFVLTLFTFWHTKGLKLSGW